MKLEVFLGLLLASAASLAQTAQSLSAEMQRCRSVPDIAARAACYDAIALPNTGPNATSNATPGTTTGAAQAAAAGALAAGNASRPNAAAPGSSASTTVAAPPAPPSTFGLPAARSEAAADQLQSRIVGLVESFPRGFEYQLENGQVWQVTDRLLGFYQLSNPKVTITRRFLGGFQMQIEGVSGSAKVRRIK